QPAVEGSIGHAEFVSGLGQAHDHRTILRSWRGRWGGRDATALAQRADPLAGEPEAGGCLPALAGEDLRDRRVVVVTGPPAHQLDRVLVGGWDVPSGPGRRHSSLHARAAFETDLKLGFPGVS